MKRSSLTKLRWSFAVLVGGLACVALAFLIRVVVDSNIQKGMAKLAVLPNPSHADDAGKDRFNLWAEPPDGERSATVKVYLYNLTNPTEALAGQQPIYSEVGPYVYALTVRRFDAVFSEGDQQVSYRNFNQYYFQPGEDGGRVSDQETIIQAYEFVRLAALPSRGAVDAFVVGPFLGSALVSFLASVQKQALPAPVGVCAAGASPGTNDPLTESWTPECWAVAFAEWGSSSSAVLFGVDPSLTAPLSALGLGYYAFAQAAHAAGGPPAVPYSVDRAAFLLAGPRGLLTRDPVGRPWAEVFLQQAPLNATWAEEGWNMTGPGEVAGMVAYLSALRDGVVSGAVAEGLGRAGALAFQGQAAARSARDWIFNFQDPMVALLSGDAWAGNSAYLVNHTSRDGTGPFSASSVPPDTVLTGKDAHERAREVVRWRGLSVLISKAELQSENAARALQGLPPLAEQGWFCDRNVQVSGREVGQIFLGGQYFSSGADELTEASTFEVWDTSALRTAAFGYGGPSSVSGAATWRFVPSSADLRSSSNSSVPGMFDMTCVTGARLFLSYPRYFGASVPAGDRVEFDPALPAASPGGSLPFYDVEPLTGAAFAGAERYALHVRSSFDYGNTTRLLPLVWVSVEGSAPDALVREFLGLFTVRDRVFLAFWVTGTVAAVLGAAATAYLLAVVRPREKDQAADERVAEARRRAEDENYAWTLSHGLGPVYVVLFMHTLVFGIVAPALPDLVLQLFDDDYPRASLFLAYTNGGAALLQFFTNPVMGTFSDVRGRKPFVLLSALGLAAQMFLVGTTLSVSSLVFAQLVRGLTDGMFTSAYSMIVDWSRVREFGQNFGLVGATIGVAFAVGPLLGAALSASGSVHVPFLFSAAVATANAVFIVVMLPETLSGDASSGAGRSRSNSTSASVLSTSSEPSATATDTTTGTPSRAPVVLLGGADSSRPTTTQSAATAPAVASSTNATSNTATTAASAPTAGVVLSPPSGVMGENNLEVEGRRTERASDRKQLRWSHANPFRTLAVLLSTSVLKRTSAAFFLNILGLSVVTVWFLYTKYSYGWGPVENGLLLFAFGCLSILAQGWLIRLVHPRWGDRRTIHILLPVQAAGFALFAAAWAGWVLYVVLVLATPGFVATPVIRGIISQEIGEARQGQLQGALAGLQNVANVVGPLTMGGIFAYFVSDSAPTHFPGAPFVLSALVNVAALAVLVSVFRSAPGKFGPHAPSEKTADSELVTYARRSSGEDSSEQRQKLDGLDGRLLDSHMEDSAGAIEVG